MKWRRNGLRNPHPLSPVSLLNRCSMSSLAGSSDGVIICLRCALIPLLFFLFLFLFSVCLAHFYLLSFFFFCLSLSLFCLLSAFGAQGTSEGSGWLSLLEADGRPKARRPQFHEAWFEHARIMSRGIPMDDGCLVCASVCLCAGKRLRGRWLIL